MASKYFNKFAFFRSMAFWGGQLYCAQIGLSGGFYKLSAFENL